MISHSYSKNSSILLPIAFDKFKGEDIDLSKFKIEINKEDSNTENDRVLIIRDKDTLINIQD